MAEAAEPEVTPPPPSPTTEESSATATEETKPGARQKLRGIVNRFSGLKPNWNLKPKVSSLKPNLSGLKWPSRAAATEKETQVLVHAINVGKGEAFLVEIQEEPGLLARVKGHSNRFYLIDGGDGCPESMENLYQCLEVRGCLPAATQGSGQVLLNGIIVTNPDPAHTAGITKLLTHIQENGWKCATPILITESFMKTFPQPVLELFQIMSTSHYKGLTFAPTQTAVVAQEDPQQENGVHFHSPGILCVPGAKKTDTTLSNILETVHNADCLLTSGLTYQQLSEGDKLKDREVKVFQVPTSVEMSSEEWFAFFSSFSVEIYLISGSGGLKREILQGIILANVPRNEVISKPCTILLTNSRGLDSEKIRDLGDDNIEWHTKIKICHVNDLFHPRVAPGLDTPPTIATPTEAMQLSYSRLKTQVTLPGEGSSSSSSGGSSEEDTPQHQTHTPSPQQTATSPQQTHTSPEQSPKQTANSSQQTPSNSPDHGPQTEAVTASEEVVGITVPKTEEAVFPPPQFATIDPKSGIGNPESILEWSPQSYIQMLKGCIERGLKPVPGKPRFPFYYQGTVSIKKENTGHYIGIKDDALPKGYNVEKQLHIVCTPVPHKPWRGDDLNLCYVVQETIECSTSESFQKVLFLELDNGGGGGGGEGQLAESQRYKMFGYDDNQWKIRQYNSLFVVNTVERVDLT